MSWHNYNNILHETICINLLQIFSLTERCFSVSVATNKSNACQSKPTADLHELWLCHAMGCGSLSFFTMYWRSNEICFGTSLKHLYKSYSHLCQPNCQIKTIIAFREQDIHNFFHCNFLLNIYRSAGMKFVHM